MPTEVYPNIYAITVKDSPQRFRVYLANDSTPTLFDTGFEDTTDVLSDSISDLEIAPDRLIITHEDPDHTGGLSDVANEFEPEIWALADDANAIENQHNITPDYRYEDGDQIGRFEAVHVPRHTPRSSVLIDEGDKVAITGDAVIGSDLRGLPEGFLLPHSQIFNDDTVAAEENIENLTDYQFDVALTYHGSAVHERASEKLRKYVYFRESPHHNKHNC